MEVYSGLDPHHRLTSSVTLAFGSLECGHAPRIFSRTVSCAELSHNGLHKRRMRLLLDDSNVETP